MPTKVFNAKAASGHAGSKTHRPPHVADVRLLPHVTVCTPLAVKCMHKVQSLFSCNDNIGDLLTVSQHYVSLSTGVSVFRPSGTCTFVTCVHFRDKCSGHKSDQP